MAGCADHVIDLGQDGWIETRLTGQGIVCFHTHQDLDVCFVSDLGDLGPERVKDVRALPIVKGTAGDRIRCTMIGKADGDHFLLLSAPDHSLGSGLGLPTRRKVRMDVKVSVDGIRHSGFTQTWIAAVPRSSLPRVSSVRS